MKYIFLNLKRFDITKSNGGVNSISEPAKWAQYIVYSIKDAVKKYSEDTEFAVFFPEAHIIPAAECGMGTIHLGCQSVFRDDVAVGGNFGAFTTIRTAQSMAQLGCDYTIIGHCEERNNLKGLMKEFGSKDMSVVNSILNREVLQAQKAGLKVLFCVGEDADEVSGRGDVLRAQLTEGLSGTDMSKVVIGYEPLWAIGPGRPVPTAEAISEVGRIIKSIVPCDVVYGGGLKEENADMVASVPEMDGGLMALTRFKGDIGFYPDEYIRIVDKYLSL